MFGFGGDAPQDPCVIRDVFDFEGYKATTGRTPRTPIINPAKKTLILILAGQSQATSTYPSLKVPTNAAAADNFNFYDGAVYDMNGPMIGCGKSPLGPGNIAGYLADQLIPTFDRVIFVPVAIGSTFVAQWSTGNMSRRIPVAIAKLASRGITPATPGVTMALLWMQGENDAFYGTPKADYKTAFNTIVANALAAGFVGRVFICKETWGNGVVTPTIQTAQTELVDNVQVFSGGNLDTLDNSYRQVDGTHFNDSGGAAVATIIRSGMRLSGAPY